MYSHIVTSLEKYHTTSHCVFLQVNKFVIKTFALWNTAFFFLFYNNPAVGYHTNLVNPFREKRTSF